MSASERTTRPSHENGANVESLARPIIEDLYRQYFPLLRNKCIRMLADRAEAQDIAQETFMRLWTKRETIDDPAAVCAWLYRTSTRLAIDSYRRTKKHRAGSTAPLGGPARTNVGETSAEASAVGENPSTPEDRAYARQILRAVSANAPTRELEAAILSRLDGLTHREIGEVLGTSDRTVRRWLERFDRRLTQLTAGDAGWKGRGA